MHTTNKQMSWRNAIMFGMIFTLASWSQAAVINVPADYATIQAAIDAADPGDTISVAAGTYDEQVVIDKSLTLQGTGDATIIKPTSTLNPALKFDVTWIEGYVVLPGKLTGIIVADGVAGVTVKNLKVDGGTVVKPEGGAPWVASILYHSSSGVIDNVTSIDMTTSSTCRGYGFYLYAAGPGDPVNVEIMNCRITNYDKNGINVHEDRLRANIHDNIITGRGSVDDEVMNGIVVILDAQATVNNNTILNHAYTPAEWLAMGINFCNAGGSAQGNTLTNNQIGIAAGILPADPWGGYTQTVSLIDNTVDASGLPAFAYPAGVGLLAESYVEGANLNVTMDGNQLSGGPNANAGIALGWWMPESYGAGHGNIVATIKNNTISNWQHGIRLRNCVATGSTITGNTITNNVSTTSGIHIEAAVNAGNVSVNFNNIVSNQGYGVFNGGTGTLDATSNWWGSGSGPSGIGPGTGDAVSSNVLFDPWVKAEQVTLIFTPATPQTYNTTNTLSISGGSGTGAVSYTVVSGPGQIVNGNGLWVTSGVGTVTLTATKSADSQYNAASATAAVACDRANQTITFPPIADQDVTNRLTLSATASSGLPVMNFAVSAGPAVISGLSNVTFTGTGLVSIVASQEGDQNWNAAPSVTNTFMVRQGAGQLAINVIPGTGNWKLSVPTGYTGPRAGTGDMAQISVPTGEYSISYGSLGGYEAPSSQTNFVIAGNTSLFVGVYLEISTNVPQPQNVSATEGIYTNKIRILWQEVAGALGYEVWRSQTNDPATAGRIDNIPATSSFAGNKNASGLSASAVQIAPSAWKSDNTYIYDDYGVVPIHAYYYWVRSKTATQISPMNYAGMGYASLSPEQATGTVDISVSDLVYLPVNVTNGSHAGTVSCRLQNNGPDILSDAGVEFNFYMGTNATGMAWIGSDQTNMTLNAGEESLMILTPQAKRGLTVRGDLSGIQQVKVTVRHLSTLNDPNLTNNTTPAAGSVRIKTNGVNSPSRSLNDYDGDGKADACLYQSALGRWYAELSGVRYGEGVWIGDVGIGWTPIPGDYDGDGLTDVAAYDRMGGQWLVRFSSSGRVVVCPFGGSEFTAAPCDFDGDAKTDPVVYCEADGYWKGAASSRGYAPCYTSLGVTGCQPVVADYDGDGLADPAVYNRENGIWLIAFSSIGYQVVTDGFGGPGYLPVSADYDGDGLADPAIYSPGTAYWQVLLSGSRETTGQYTWWGGVAGNINGIPVPADYDGDGKADLVVYHQATGIWELFLSTRGYQEFSGGFGDPDYQPVME